MKPDIEVMVNGSLLRLRDSRLDDLSDEMLGKLVRKAARLEVTWDEITIEKPTR